MSLCLYDLVFNPYYVYVVYIFVREFVTCNKTLLLVLLLVLVLVCVTVSVRVTVSGTVSVTVTVSVSVTSDACVQQRRMDT